MEREALCGYKPRKAPVNILSENFRYISEPQEIPVRKETVRDYFDDLPSSYNAITYGYVTPIKNQKNCGSCWIFATISDLESDVAISESQKPDFSEQQVGNCNILSDIGGFDFCNGGNAYNAINYLTKYGSADEACDPYTAIQSTCRQCPILKNVDNWRIITDFDGNESFHISTIKNAILNYGPVFSTIYSSDLGFHFYKGGVYEYWGPENVDHSIGIIGWDDSLEHSNGTGAWLIKNSWGDNWGLETYPGCAWVAYGSANIGDKTSAISGYKDPGDSILYHDEGGWLNNYGTNSTIVYGAVRFTPTNGSTLTAVDFWAVDTNMNYEITIFDTLCDLSGGDYNFSDRLGNTRTGTTNERGYYSILLDTPVKLTGGNDFIIQIKFETLQNRYPLPVEDNTIYTFSGESYYSNNSLRFRKSSPYDIGIRARTISQTTITGPEEKAYVKGTVFINGTADDTDFKYFSVEWINTTVDWTEIQNSSESVSNGILAMWDTNVIEDGNYTIRLTVLDIASSSVSTSVNVTIDNTQPTAIIEIPGEGTLISGTVNISGTANDHNFKSFSVEWKNTTVDWTRIYNSTEPVSDGILAMWDTNVMDNGNYVVRVTATDKALNSNIAVTNTTIHNKQQCITNVDCETTSSTAAITWNTIGYPTNSIIKYYESLDTTIFEKTNTEYVESHSIYITGLKPNTTYYYYITGIDRFGNTNESSLFSFTTATVPSVMIHSPPPITNDSGPVLNASFDRTVTSTRYILDGRISSRWHNIDNLSIRLPQQPDGLHRVIVEAIDYDGNFGENIGITIQNFIVDTILPTAIISLPEKGAFINGKTEVDIIGTARDTNFKNYKLELNGPSGSWIELQNSNEPVHNETLGIWNISDVKDGNYTVKLTVMDNASNENHTVTYFTINNTSHDSNNTNIGDQSGGKDKSGDGVGSTSGENFYNIVLTETNRQRVFKNSRISFDFKLEDNTVRYINFTALKSYGTVTAKVEILNNTSILVNSPPPDKVYKNLNIWVGNSGWATQKNIADTTVSFKVEKLWVKNNDISEGSILLYHYSNGDWTKLATTKTGEDQDNLYFEAEVTEFSPFAVTGKKAIVRPGSEGITVGPAATVDKTPVPVPVKSKETPGLCLFISVLVLFIAVRSIREKK